MDCGAGEQGGGVGNGGGDGVGRRCTSAVGQLPVEFGALVVDLVTAGAAKSSSSVASRSVC